MRMRLALSALLATALVMTGCGSDQEPSADAKPTASPSPTAPPGVDTESPQKPGGLTATTPSAVEYARWFAQLVQYALEARNSRVVSQEAFDQAACRGCRSLATFVAQLEQSGFWQVSDELDVGRLRATTHQGVVRVQGPVTYPRVRDLTVEGSVSKTIPAKPYDYDVDVSWDDGAKTWQVRDFHLQPHS